MGIDYERAKQELSQELCSSSISFFGGQAFADAQLLVVVLPLKCPKYWTFTVNLQHIGSAIRERREALGLTQARLAQMSGLSRQTLVGLEAGSLTDLGYNRVGQVMTIVGLDVEAPTKLAREKKRGLWMAAKTASVSYSCELAPDTLGQALASGDIPEPYVAHMAHLFEEAPLPVIVMAVEEAASREHVTPRAIWRNVEKLAKALSIQRQGVWA